MTTPNELKSYRETYRAIRKVVCAKKGISPKAFDTAAQSGASEYADGEEITPYAWLMGARYAAADFGIPVQL